MQKDRNPYRILVVEDNAGDLMLIRDYLEEEMPISGVLNAQSYTEAIKVIEAHPDIEVLLLDLSLPDKNGEELVVDILSVTHGIPVIILTGYGDLNFAMRALSLGASDYLLKDNLNPTILYKSIIYNIERNKYIFKLRESEQRYSDLFQLSPQPTWVYERATLQFLDINEAAIRHYGYSRPDFLSMTLKDIHPQSESNSVEDLVKSGASYHGNFRHQKKGGETIYVEVKSDNIIYNSIEAKIVMINDISERKRAQEELLTITYQVEDRERTRISHVIHDALQQTLLASYIQFQSLGTVVNEMLEEKFIIRYTKSLKLLYDGIEQARTITHELMPPALEEGGYVLAVKDLLAKYNGASLEFFFSANLNNHTIPKNTELILFRVTQEMINNIVKHSKATIAQLSVIGKDGYIQIKIVDNGVGFDASKTEVTHSFGLKTVTSRLNSIGGNFAVSSQTEKGTTVTLSIPSA